METNNRSIENFNELVFENRHKEYGAYAIRKSYNDTITHALFVTCAFFGLLALGSVLFNKNRAVVDKQSPPLIDTLISVPFVMQPPEELKNDFKKEVEKKTLKSDDLNYQPEDKKVETMTKTNDQAMTIKDGEEKGTDTTRVKDIPEDYTAKAPEPVKDDIKDLVDQMPEFDGNLYQFIRDQIQYPREAIQNGTFGTVGLSFVVEMDGSIGAIKILNAVGDGCTEEAIRVLKLMPKWRPGKNHGQLVRVRYNIPVKFRLK